MAKVVPWLLGIILENRIELVVSGAAGTVSWFFCSSLWAGWRSVGIAIATSIMVGGVIAICRKEYRAQHSGQPSKTEMKALLDSLDQFERNAINAFRQQNTIELPIDNPVVSGLEAKGILVRARKAVGIRIDDNQDWHHTCAMMLSPLAEKLLRNPR